MINPLLWLRRPKMKPLPPAPQAARWPLWLGVGLALLLSLYLYAGTLNLPFLQEDSFHIRWLTDLSPLDVFFTAAGAPDYRPLGKALLKMWSLILGEHNAPWLRFQNIAFNLLNIALLARLASWLDRSPRRYLTGGLAALLYAALPFAYQAIPWINNFFYPLSVLLLLLMTAVYWQARLRNSNRLLALALFFTFLAPFEIEYGIMGGSVLFFVEVALWWQGRQDYPWLGGPLLGLVMNLLFLARSLTIPKAPYAFGPPTLRRLLWISTYFVQGLAFPLSPLAVPLMAATGLNEVGAIWLVALPVLAGLGVLLWRQRQRPLLVLAFGWFALLNLPALVFVDFSYVENSPRLLYPPGVAVVWLWGAALATLAWGNGRFRQNLLRGTVAALLVLAILWQNVAFVQNVMAHYQLAARPAGQLAAAAQAADPDNHLLVVNYPSWITPGTDIFALGNHGAQIIPFYIGLSEFVYATNGEDQLVTAVQFTNIRQEQPYYHGMLGERVDYDALRGYLDANDDVLLTEWSPTRLDLVWAGRTGDVAMPAADACFGGQVCVALTDITEADGALTVRLAWQIEQPVTDNWTVFAHLYAPDGTLAAQADGYPLRGLAPFWLWDSPQTLAESRTFALPADLSPGDYRLGVGVYDANSGARIPAIDAAGVALVDDVAILATVLR